MRTKEESVAAYTYLKTSDVAGHLGVSSSHVVAMIQAGDLPAVNVGSGKRNEWRVHAEALGAFKRDRDREARAKRPPPDADTVYIVAAQGAGRVKIGFTNNLVARLRALRTSSPMPLRVRSAWLAPQTDETRLHDALGAMRTHGEWFDSGAAPMAESLLRGWGRKEAP